jgi:hypothetical protein
MASADLMQGIAMVSWSCEVLSQICVQFQSLAKPLTSLLKKHPVFVWTSVQWDLAPQAIWRWERRRAVGQHRNRAFHGAEDSLVWKEYVCLVEIVYLAPQASSPILYDFLST